MKKLILLLTIAFSSLLQAGGLITVQIVNDSHGLFQYYQVNTWGINKDGSSVNLQYTSPQDIATAQAILNMIDSGFQRNPTLSTMFLNDDNTIKWATYMIASDAKQQSPTLSPTPVSGKDISASATAAVAQVIINAQIKSQEPENPPK